MVSSIAYHYKRTLPHCIGSWLLCWGRAGSAYQAHIHVKFMCALLFRLCVAIPCVERCFLPYPLHAAAVLLRAFVQGSHGCRLQYRSLNIDSYTNFHFSWYIYLIYLIVIRITRFDLSTKSCYEPTSTDIHLLALFTGSNSLPWSLLC